MLTVPCRGEVQFGLLARYFAISRIPPALMTEPNLSPFRRLRRLMRRIVRRAMAALPRPVRFSIIRWMIDCDPNPDPRLTFQIAETKEELEACFRILHDAYVAQGYMRPAPSGLRVTSYHALPTTTTLCAKFDGRVIGTITIIRDGVFGFPLQSAFDLAPVRDKGGNIAEISALAIDPAFRKSGGSVLFPLLKFMYGYCRDYFDTRHLIIAVNPKMIELYESVLFFERLAERPVKRYAFANGAPAVGATLDLAMAPDRFRAAYGGRTARKDLYDYFVSVNIKGIRMPERVISLTNDPVLTPELLDHFFNRRTDVFSTLDARQLGMLREVYVEPAFRQYIPAVEGGDPATIRPRRHKRFTLRCQASLKLIRGLPVQTLKLVVVDVSQAGCRAEADIELPEGASGELDLEWGLSLKSRTSATVVRQQRRGNHYDLGFTVAPPDATWNDCVQALQSGITVADLGRLRTELRPAAA